jgi:hypothetical protein
MASAAAIAAAGGGKAIPVFFIANRGQAPSSVQFMVRGSGLTAYFLPTEVDLRLDGHNLRVQWEGANPPRLPEGRRLMGGRANFLGGEQGRPAIDVPLYESLAYRELYPGIDLLYGGAGRSLKSEYLISPGADPALIRIRYLGGDVPVIDTDGSLVVRLGNRELREQPPFAYQERAGVRRIIRARYSVSRDGAVGFELGAYNRAQALVIDPVLSFSTLLGGAGTDTATALAVDSGGAAYIAGYTDSLNLPGVNSTQSFNAGGTDVFVAKLNVSGNSLVYCTYLGGSADDRAYAIAVDAQGNAYLAGSTTSSNFPVRGALQPKLAGSRNAFVAKLNPAGNGLVYSTYLGGNASDSANGIAVDASGAAYVVGDTTSYSFPSTGFQRSTHGGQDAFVAKVSADGTKLVYSTYLGGSADDRGTAIAVDASGTAYITGSTFSTDFPVANSAQRANAGGQDAFVARLSADGNYLLYGTYLGGSGGTAISPEMGQAIDVDAAGNVYVAGITSSPNFPIVNALQTSLRGFSDGFIAKITPSGTLGYSTYLGGSSSDTATGIVVDSSGNAFVSGYTYSSDLPVAGALQPGNAGEYDAFIAELNPSGNSLLYLSYLGGSGSDAASSIALDSFGNVYVAGWTLSTNFPLKNSYQQVNSGNYGAFVSKIAFNLQPANAGVTPSSGSGATQVFSLQYSDPQGASSLSSVSALVGGSSNTSSACAVVYDRGHNTLALLTDAGQVPSGSLTPGSGSQQNSQCSINGAASSVVLSGQTLTLNLALSFFPAFAGSKSIYMQAANPVASTPWQSKGSWTVTFAVSNISVSPASGSGVSQTFSFQFSDEAGANDLSFASVLFNSSPSATGGCSVTYDSAHNALFLLTDSGQTPSGSISPGTGGQQNSQCSLNGAASSVLLLGRILTLNLAFTFFPAFSGPKNIYMQAASPFGSAPQ